MNIIEKTYTLNGTLTKRTKTDTIYLHHAVYNGPVEDIDRMHKNNGWTCIGYHFYVRKDGSIYRGRREDSIGAHAYGYNSTSIGICAEGNFETDIMGEAQKQAIIELVNYLKDKYGITKVLRHKDVNKTACPGRNYPYEEIINGKSKENNIVKEEFEVAKVYKNGSTPEPVYADTSLTKKTGSLNKWEQCECLAIVNRRYLVKYKVDGSDEDGKPPIYKCGFVGYSGGVK